MPFPVLSIQTDGGSEFMVEFEEGCGEHANRIRQYRIPEPLRRCSDGRRSCQVPNSKHEIFCNYEMPHASFDCINPNECVIAKEAARFSSAVM